MKSCSSFKICFLLGLSLSAIEFPQRAIAADPLPDASVVAYASYKKQAKPPPPPKVSDVTLTGRINAVQANGLMITAGTTSKARNQAKWLVVSAADTEVNIHATATLDYLRAGQTIEFSGQIIKGDKAADKPTEEKSADASKDEKATDKPKDDKVAKQAKDDKAGDKPKDEKVADKTKEEKVADTVEELTIFSHKGDANKARVKDHAADPGVGGARVKPAKPETDSEKPLAESGDSKSATGAASPAKAKTDASAAAAKTKIVGRIAACDAKSLTVTAGERTIHLDLADTPTIYVELSNPKITPDTADIKKTKIEGAGSNGHLVSLLASNLIGAKIVVHGMGQETRSAKQCGAKTIDVTISTPLTGKTSTSTPPKKAVADK